MSSLNALILSVCVYTALHTHTTHTPHTQCQLTHAARILHFSICDCFNSRLIKLHDSLTYSTPLSQIPDLSKTENPQYHLMQSAFLMIDCSFSTAFTIYHNTASYNFSSKEERKSPYNFYADFCAPPNKRNSEAKNVPKEKFFELSTEMLKSLLKEFGVCFFVFNILFSIYLLGGHGRNYCIVIGKLLL